MGGDQNRLFPFKAGQGDLLERVELEGVGLGHLAIVQRVRKGSMEGFVDGRRVAIGDCNLVDAGAGEIAPFRCRFGFWGGFIRDLGFGVGAGTGIGILFWGFPLAERWRFLHR